MKLKIIGSGNIFSKQNSASYLIDDKILIDVPNGTCKTLKNMGIEPSKIEHILITHFHGDHFLDIPFVLLNKRNDNSEYSNIYCDNTGENKVYDVTKLAFPNKVECIKKYFRYIYDDKFNIDKYKIEKIRLEHEEGIEANGYIFNIGNKYVGFTGDTRLCENVEKMASKCSHLICICNSVIGKKSSIGVDNLQELAIKYPNCVFYTTHMSDIARKNLKELNMENIVVLNDNDEFIF